MTKCNRLPLSLNCENFSIATASSREYLWMINSGVAAKQLYARHQSISAMTCIRLKDRG
jgi:hypothetical protein